MSPATATTTREAVKPAYDLGFVMPTTTALAEIPKRPSIVEELALARRVSNVARDGFTIATHGSQGFSKTRTQKIGNALGYDFTMNTILGGMVSGILGALLVGGVTSYIAPAQPDLSLWNAVYFGGAVAAVTGAAVAFAKVVRNISDRQARRLVEPKDVGSVLKTLSQGTPEERAIAGSQVAFWRGKLDSAKRVTPDARTQLIAREDELRPADVKVTERAARMARIAEFMDGTEPLTTWEVSKLRRDLDALEPAERHPVASMIVDAIRDSKREKNYDAEHEVFELPRHYAAAVKDAAKDAVQAAA